MKDVEDISVQLEGCTLIIKYPDINYSYWKSFKDFKNDDDLVIILDDLLICLDVTIKFAHQRLLYTNQMMYEKYISDFYFYLIHLTNYATYNKYFDLLIQRHSSNIDYEYNNPVIEKVTIAKSKGAASKKVSNKFIRQVTTDMFTNKEKYIYINNKTGEQIESDDPNKLDELNASKKKAKVEKHIGVPITSMTFSFKKKE